ncbi:hypothetical protein [Lysobacter firmicutimachus]|uniref:Tetratricopeptide repeat protein n=1 Tax=Lysobacter firmicutimachus TaxID=1792846 RepID=A0ABU8D8L5_9GAMM
MSRPFALLLLILAASPAQALTFADQTLVCPIDGKSFTARVMSSGTSFGRYFDTRPFGPIAAPAPLPACPGNGFIVVEQREYSAEELTRLRAFVASEEYRGWIANETPYYRLARQMAFAGASPDAAANVWLQATWDADAERYPRYAEQALQAWRQRAQRQAGSEEGVHARLVVGELQRRLGRFDEARASFLAVRADPALQRVEDAETRDYLGQIVAAQLQLVQARDTRNARLDDDGAIVHF